jgi:two-component system cell cycle sensor histidine kinase/response regulator CckA
MAHDFNNLLTTIVGAAELLGEVPTLADDDREDVATIVRSVERATHLTRQLAALSRPRVPHPDLWDVGQVISELRRTLARLLGQDVALEITVDPAPAFVYLDRAQLEQLVINLALVARDAMPTGGALRIATGPHDGLPSGEVARGAPSPMVAPAGLVAIVVADTGVGMTPDHQRRLLEPHAAAELPSTVGLGLPVVGYIVEALGGAVAVASTPGEGTTVTVVLPLSPKVEEPGREASPAAEMRGGPRQVLLLVEDDPAVRLTVSRMLKSRHFDVLACATPAEARAIAAREGGRIDLVLSDIVMPQMSGLELLALLRDAGVTAPAAFMSGYAGHDVVDRLALDGATTLLQKPFTREQLVAVIDRIAQGGAPGEDRGDGA